MAIITGVPGDDELFGTPDNDEFRLFAVGDFIASGLGGNDQFIFHGNFTSADRVDGGTGKDTIQLDGDYSGASAIGFAANDMLRVEVMALRAGHSYDIATHDTNVSAGQTLAVKASGLGAAHVLTFDGSAETNGRFEIDGGAGADVLTGGNGNDVFSLTTGGDDAAQGGHGKDRFLLGGTFTAADAIDGGSGEDVVVLKGNYGVVDLVLTATTLVNVEEVNLKGSSYDITTVDATVGAGVRTSFNGTELSAAQTLRFDGTAETDGVFGVSGGAGDDTLLGGAGNDVFSLARGGDDTAVGGDGDDVFHVGAGLTADDRIDGGAGTDKVKLGGDYLGFTFDGLLMAGVERLQLGHGHDYDLIFEDAAVGAGATLTVDGSGLVAGDTLTFDGGAETDGRFNLTGGAGNDTLTGGVKGDALIGGAGADTFGYGGASQSTSTTRDTVSDFDALVDLFDLDFAVAGVVNRNGAINEATFDADLGNAVGDVIGVNGVALVLATGGDLGGHTFVVGDADGNALYDGGTDYVIDITGFTGTITTGNFV